MEKLESNKNKKVAKKETAKKRNTSPSKNKKEVKKDNGKGFYAIYVNFDAKKHPSN